MKKSTIFRINKIEAEISERLKKLEEDWESLLVIPTHAIADIDKKSTFLALDYLFDDFDAHLEKSLQILKKVPMKEWTKHGLKMKNGLTFDGRGDFYKRLFLGRKSFYLEFLVEMLDDNIS